MPPDPSNDNEKMDELLKACAKKRAEQAGAPFEMHPATRAMLQGEVARKFPQMKEKPARKPFFFRLALAGTMAAALLVCAVMIFQHHPTQPAPIALTQNNPQSEAPEGSALDVRKAVPVDEPASAPANGPAIALAPPPPSPAFPVVESGGSLSLSGSGNHFALAPSVSEKDAEATRNELDRIIIPKIDFQNASAKDAIASLNKVIAGDATENKAPDNITIVLKPEPVLAGNGVGGGNGDGGGNGMFRAGSAGQASVGGAAPVAVEAAPAVPAATGLAPQPLAAGGEGGGRINLTLTNTTLSNALVSIAAASHLKVELGVNTVNLIPDRESNDLLITREYPIASNFPGNNGVATLSRAAPGAADNDATTKATADFSNGKTADLPANAPRAFLEQNGVPFPAGADAYVVPGENKLVVTNTEPNQALVGAIMDTGKDLAAAAAPAGGIDGANLKQMQSQKLASAFTILSTFQIQMKGSQIRIVDSDGSVYTGEIRQPYSQKQIAASSGFLFTNVAAESRYKYAAAVQSQMQNEQMKSQPSSMVSAATSNSSAPIFGAVMQPAIAGQGLAFRATGTNVKLNKPVVIEGFYFPAQIAQQTVAKKEVERQEQANADAAQVPDKAKFAAQAPARIQGQAMIGTQAIDIDAVAEVGKAGK